MRFRDFSIVSSKSRADYCGYVDWDAVNRATFPFSEAFFHELRSRPPIVAPFAKLSLGFENEPRDVYAQPWVAVGVLEVWRVVPEGNLLASEARRTEACCDAVEGAFDEIERHLGWRDDAAYDIVRTLRERGNIGWIERPQFGRKLKGGRSARVFYDLTSETPAYYVAIWDGNEEICRVCVARARRAYELEDAFPLHSVALLGSTFVLRDRNRETLATVDLEDLSVTPTPTPIFNPPSFRSWSRDRESGGGSL